MLEYSDDEINREIFRRTREERGPFHNDPRRW
jgi:hypothetical protein